MTDPRLRRAAAPNVNWARALEQVVFVTREHRRPTVSAAEACLMLRISPADLDRLTDQGLPCAGVGEDRWFDYRDVYNLCLWSCSGTSLPEQSLAIRMRFAARPVEDLLARRRWLISIVGSCDRCAESPTPDVSWQVRQPELPAVGGRTLSWAVSTGARGAGDGDSRSPAGRRDLVVEGVVETVGITARLVSPGIRGVVDRFLQRGLRWHLVYAEQWLDLPALHRSGVTNCITASLEVADRLQEMGFRTATRRGWMSGFVNVPHAWLEVEDEDGVLKTVDLTMPDLVSLVGSDGESYRRRLPLGTIINRVIRADCPADEPLVEHRHGADVVGTDVVTEVRPVLDPALDGNGRV